MVGFGSVAVACAVDVGVAGVAVETAVWVGVTIDAGAHALKKSSPIAKSCCHRIILFHSSLRCLASTAIARVDQRQKINICRLPCLVVLALRGSGGLLAPFCSLAGAGYDRSF